MNIEVFHSLKNQLESDLANAPGVFVCLLRNEYAEGDEHMVYEMLADIHHSEYPQLYRCDAIKQTLFFGLGLAHYSTAIVEYFSSAIDRFILAAKHVLLNRSIDYNAGEDSVLDIQLSIPG